MPSARACTAIDGHIQDALPAHRERQLPAAVGLGPEEVEALDIVQEVGRELVAAEAEFALTPGPRLAPEIRGLLGRALKAAVVEVPAWQSGLSDDVSDAGLQQHQPTHRDGCHAPQPAQPSRWNPATLTGGSARPQRPDDARRRARPPRAQMVARAAPRASFAGGRSRANTRHWRQHRRAAIADFIRP